VVVLVVGCVVVVVVSAVVVIVADVEVVESAVDGGGAGSSPELVHAATASNPVSRARRMWPQVTSRFLLRTHPTFISDISTDETIDHA
jgi:hypothetical protein